jgi:phosphatidylserine/phosphatidylglycerophosphate/cardiolipin synthase-like enzyme
MRGNWPRVRLPRGLDDALGARLEATIKRHHRRRLAGIGWLHALDAEPGGWAAGGPEPRDGNAVEVLVDGAEALPAIAGAIRSARSHVHLAGWHFAPDFQLEQRGVSLRELLADATERAEVRVLAWAGAPLPLFHPDRGEVKEAVERLTGGTRIRHALDSRERPLHCHHEKLVIVDGEVAFVGGIDLSSLGGDRFDRSDHPARGALGWHDATARLRGPAVADVADHFAFRWREVTGEALPIAVPPAPAGDATVQVVRTVPERIYGALPRGHFRILESYLRALRSAERLIYLENQFLWSPEIVDVLLAKLDRPPCDEFRIVVVLPAHAKSGDDDSRGQVGLLAAADRDGKRLLACSLYQRGSSPPQQVYVHAKIGIVDDRWLTIGSANLNEHSLFNDTEVNLVVAGGTEPTALRRRLWAEHLECDPGDLEGEAHEIVDNLWRPRADEQLRRIRRGEPPQHRLVRLPTGSQRTAQLLGPINGLLVDG